MRETKKAAKGPRGKKRRARPKKEGRVREVSLERLTRLLNEESADHVKKPRKKINSSTMASAKRKTSALWGKGETAGSNPVVRKRNSKRNAIRSQSDGQRPRGEIDWRMPTPTAGEGEI